MLDWDDLRFFLELSRAGTRARAGRKLHVDETTVARRLQRLERELGGPLVERAPGRVVLTELGEQVRASAERMEEPALAVEHESPAPQLSGRVRVAAPELLGQHFVLAALMEVRTRHPGIQLELLTGLTRIDVRRREADIAVRTVRPTEPSLVVKRVARFAVATYVRAGWRGKRPSAALGFVDGAKLPIRGLEDREPLPVALRTNAIATMVEAVRLGWGAADLPCFVADATPGLQRLAPAEPPQFMDIWLVVHTHAQHTPRIRAVFDGLARAFAANAPLLAGRSPGVTRRGRRSG